LSILFCNQQFRKRDRFIFLSIKKRVLGRITALHKRGIIFGLKAIDRKMKIGKRGRPKKEGNALINYLLAYYL